MWMGPYTIDLRSNSIRIRWVYSPPDGRADQGTGVCSRGKCAHVTWTFCVLCVFLFLLYNYVLHNN